VIHDDKSDRGMGVVTAATALARSSDVAAVKLALQVGPDRFYQYIRDFGFGSRTNIELPGETRGLLRPVNRWGGSSIGSIAIGQEVAVTPVQLVTMVSTIANGGVYLPPHVLMPETKPATAPNQKSAASQVSRVSLVPRPFRADEELPNPLPQGAHRVVTALTAAQMRKMMEGVVLFGTGKSAQLNGYSSAGKTGTAQKIDPATHLYSKTMHIASFAGFAPVNNPVISVAVIIDTPKGEYYGASVSAPVFAEVAQQVLEYLGVRHDIELRPTSSAAKNSKPVHEDDSDADAADIQSLFLAANDLPSDDPLRAVQPAQTSSVPSSPNQDQTNQPATSQRKVAVATQSTVPGPSAAQQSTNAVVNTAKLVAVPTLIGLPLRRVVEQAGAAGFDVEISGNGTARDQMPAAGTMVRPGTKIVVRCSR
jgi:cell division protein FtsI (penicillin-binding protein 3)